jgi:hypothetical protein
MIKHFVGCLLLACLLVSPLLAQTPAGKPGQVPGFIVATHVKGEVTAKDLGTGETVALAENQRIRENFVVTTSKTGSVILIFENGATVAVQEDSELDIQKFEMDPFNGPETKVADLTKEPTVSTTNLSMPRGKLVGKVVHLNYDGGSEFTIATPVGAAGIRGTTFYLNFTPNSDGTALFQLVTSDGTVLFTAPASVQGIPVPTGKQVSTVVTLTQTSQPGQPATYASTGTIASSDVPSATLAQIAAVAQTIIDTELNSNITLTSTSTSTGTSTSGTSTSTSTSTSGTTTSGSGTTSAGISSGSGNLLNVPAGQSLTPND